jgi:hypothetical protein
VKNRYRIKSTEIGSFSIDVKYWWWPFWIPATNTSYGTVDEARSATMKLINAGRIVEEVREGNNNKQ